MTQLKYTLDVSPDADALTVHAAESFAEHARAAVAERGRFAVSLSGGSTPKALFQMLASERFRERVDWPRVFLFWGDERCVPPDHGDSNYRMTRENLLDPLGIPTRNVHRIEGELPPGEAAAKYRYALSRFFDEAPLPRFDLLYLGMGDDGHTASLFPGTEALHERTLSVTENYVPKFRAHRVTLTVPALNHARHIVFLVSGASKADMLHNILKGPYQPEQFPSQFIQPDDGTLTWMTDAGAAEKVRQ